MTKYLISFPGSAMDISDEDMAAVSEAAHTVIREAKDAGVYVFGGGINEDVAPLMGAADGTVTNETYPQTKEFDGGFCVLEPPSREAAVNGPRRSPKPAAARRNSASSGTTPRADRRGRSRCERGGSFCIYFLHCHELQTGNTRIPTPCRIASSATLLRRLRTGSLGRLRLAPPHHLYSRNGAIGFRRQSNGQRAPARARLQSSP